MTLIEQIRQQIATETDETCIILLSLALEDELEKVKKNA